MCIINLKINLYISTHTSHTDPKQSCFVLLCKIYRVGANLPRKVKQENDSNYAYCRGSWYSRNSV